MSARDVGRAVLALDEFLIRAERDGQLSIDAADVITAEAEILARRGAGAYLDYVAQLNGTARRLVAVGDGGGR